MFPKETNPADFRSVLLITRPNKVVLRETEPSDRSACIRQMHCCQIVPEVLKEFFARIALAPFQEKKGTILTVLPGANRFRNTNGSRSPDSVQAADFRVKELHILVPVRLHENAPAVHGQPVRTVDVSPVDWQCRELIRPGQVVESRME